MTQILSIVPADFNEIKSILEKVLEELSTIKKSSPLTETWLDNQDVCEMLHVSKRTLQNYRDNGLLPFSQIGAKIYYKASDIEKHLDDHYVNLKISKSWN